MHPLLWNEELVAIAYFDHIFLQICLTANLLPVQIHEGQLCVNLSFMSWLVNFQGNNLVLLSKLFIEGFRNRVDAIPKVLQYGGLAKVNIPHILLFNKLAWLYAPHLQEVIVSESKEHCALNFIDFSQQFKRPWIHTNQLKFSLVHQWERDNLSNACSYREPLRNFIVAQNIPFV